MRTILATAYAVNPYKGSEEGTGWNFINEIARRNQVIAVTRKNNQEHIDKYMQEHVSTHAHFENIRFLYFDLPKWMILWKKGPLLSALYFYIWQLCLAIWLFNKKLSFDIAHSINFHSNWTPSFLWILGKPFFWGPVGNHNLIPFQYIKNYGWKAVLKDRILWLVKCIFWYLDPAVYICKIKAVKIFCVNTQTKKLLRLSSEKMIVMPAVASEKQNMVPSQKGSFLVLSVGRFVPLKGFDLTIKSFAAFYKNLPPSQQSKTTLMLIGTGPQKKMLLKLIKEEGLQNVITIKEWMPRAAVIQLFSKASVYLFPSHEGAGMVIAEALSYGVPVVCLNNYGPGEYIHPNSKLSVAHNKYSETVCQLSDRLQTLFSDNNFIQSEKKLALEQYENIFRWSKKEEIINEAYDQMIAQPFTHFKNSIAYVQ